MIIEQVSNRIKNLRFQKNNMSQQELADLVGCSRQTINALENNRYSLSYILEKKDCLYLTLVSKR